MERHLPGRERRHHGFRLVYLDGDLLAAAKEVVGDEGIRFAKATCGSIRLKLLKVAALVRISVRRIKFAMASGCPYQSEFQAAHARLSAAAA